MPAYLAVVPLSVALQPPLRREAEGALPLLEAVEQRAATLGMTVDSRIERGRTIRQALRLLMENESFDRVVAAGASNGHDGFSPGDVAWLLENAPGEVLILRPSRKAAVLPAGARDERRDDRVSRVLFRMPEHAQREAAVS